MGLDSIFKRYFAAIVCALIGAAAYFQAAGMGTLVASSVALDPSSVALVAPVPPPRALPLPAPTDHVTNAAAILSRNPFDSVTGPLDGKSIDLPSAETAKVEANENPYDDAECDVARALMVIASEDPLWSFAALAGADGKTVLRRQGDEIGGYTVDFIGDYRTPEQLQTGETAKPGFWDRVWLKSPTGARCQIKLGGKPPVKAAPPPEKPRAGKGVPKEIADKIHKISPNEFNIERSVVDNILENQAELMKSARILPEKEGDKVVGIRLFGVKQDSLLGLLGIENGDRLGSINGYEMGNPQSALEAYTKLRTADTLTVAVNRHNQPVNIVFNIK